MRSDRQPTHPWRPATADADSSSPVHKAFFLADAPLPSVSPRSRASSVRLLVSSTADRNQAGPLGRGTTCRRTYLWSYSHVSLDQPPGTCRCVARRLHSERHHTLGTT